MQSMGERGRWQQGAMTRRGQFGPTQLRQVSRSSQVAGTDGVAKKGRSVCPC
jgi:hypothetical protein